MENTGDLAVRALAAIAAGAILGLPYRKRPAGVSTHALVALGGFAYCSIARSITSDTSDALRVVQGVAQGVGFVGAAAVLKTRRYIVGITTAASVWIAGATGALALFDHPARALGFAALAAISNVAIRHTERRYLAHTRAMPVPDGVREGRASSSE